MTPYLAALDRRRRRHHRRRSPKADVIIIVVRSDRPSSIVAGQFAK